MLLTAVYNDISCILKNLPDMMAHKTFKSSEQRDNHSLNSHPENIIKL